MNFARFIHPRRAWLAAICALALCGCGHSAKNDPVIAINEFFADLSKQQYERAYDSASLPMRALFSETAFEALARDFGLGNFTSFTWTTESATAKEAHLTGQYVARNNQNMRFRATMLKEDGRWRLYSLEIGPPETPDKYADFFGRIDHGTTFNEAFTRKLPNDDEVRKLVAETMEKFNECLHEGDFKPFYDSCSAIGQAKYSEAQVSRAFRPYLEAHYTLDFTKDVPVVFDEPPRLNSEGCMLVNGYYPTTPRVVFHLLYAFEFPKWKIADITISIGQ